MGGQSRSVYGSPLSFPYQINVFPRPWPTNTCLSILVTEETAIGHALLPQTIVTHLLHYHLVGVSHLGKKIVQGEITCKQNGIYTKAIR